MTLTSLEVTRLEHPALIEILQETNKQLQKHAQYLTQCKAAVLQLLHSAIGTFQEYILSLQQEGYFIRKNQAQWKKKYGDKNPLLAVIKLLQRKVQDATDRESMLQYFLNAIDIIKSQEGDYYQGKPRLYKIFEDQLTTARRLDYLPRQWDTHLINAALADFSQETQYFFERLKNKKTTYRLKILEELHEHIRRAASKNSLKQIFQLVLKEVQAKDSVLAVHLQNILSTWSVKSFLSLSFEEKEGVTKSQLMKTKDLLEQRKSDIDNQFIMLKNKVKMAVDVAILRIDQYKAMLQHHDMVMQWLDKLIQIYVIPFSIPAMMGDRDIVAVQQQIHHYFLTILNHLGVVNMQSMDRKAKKAVQNIYCILVKTYDELVSTQVLPSNFLYKKQCVKSQIITAFDRYEHRATVQVSNAKYQSYRTLLMSIDQAKEPMDLSHSLDIAQIQAQVHHENRSFLCNIKATRYKHSRWAIALKEIQQKNEWLPTRQIKDSVTLYIIAQVNAYLKKDWVYHNRRRRQQANALIVQLYTIAVKYVDDVIGMRQKQRKILIEHIHAIKHDHESRQVVANVLRLSKPSRLVQCLTAAQMTLENSTVLPAVDYERTQLPLIQQEVADIFKQYKEKYPAKDLATDAYFVAVQPLQQTVLQCVNIAAAQVAFQLVIQRLEYLIQETTPPMSDAFLVTIGQETAPLLMLRLLRNAYQALVDAQLFKSRLVEPEQGEKLTAIANSTADVVAQCQDLKKEFSRCHSMC